MIQPWKPAPDTAYTLPSATAALRKSVVGMRTLPAARKTGCSASRPSGNDAATQTAFMHELAKGDTGYLLRRFAYYGQQIIKFRMSPANCLYWTAIPSKNSSVRRSCNAFSGSHYSSRYYSTTIIIVPPFLKLIPHLLDLSPQSTLHNRLNMRRSCIPQFEQRKNPHLFATRAASPARWPHETPAKADPNTKRANANKPPDQTPHPQTATAADSPRYISPPASPIQNPPETSPSRSSASPPDAPATAHTPHKILRTLPHLSEHLRINIFHARPNLRARKQIHRIARHHAPPQLRHLHVKLAGRPWHKNPPLNPLPADQTSAHIHPSISPTAHPRPVELAFLQLHLNAGHPAVPH